ncbi:unnamed protein product, partial [Amoebophrya sp. A25]
KIFSVNNFSKILKPCRKKVSLCLPAAQSSQLSQLKLRDCAVAILEDVSRLDSGSAGDVERIDSQMKEQMRK